MKKLLSVCAILCLSSAVIFAKPLDRFNDVMNILPEPLAKKCLEHLSKDMGKIMTSGDYGISASLGLGGIDINVKVNTTKVSNEIMEAEGTTQLYMPMLSAAVGLIGGLDIIGKYGYFYDSNLFGAGLRYNVYDSSVMFIPSVTVQGVYSVLNIDSNSNKVNNNNIDLGVIATFPIPFVTPYIGAGWDKTTTEAKSSNYEGMSVSTDKFTYGFGVSVSVAVLNGSLGVTYNDGIPNYTFGLSLGF